jgi:hypothetical protein
MKIPNTRFHENPSAENPVVPCGRKDGQTDGWTDEQTDSQTDVQTEGPTDSYDEANSRFSKFGALS